MTLKIKGLRGIDPERAYWVENYILLLSDSMLFIFDSDGIVARPSLSIDVEKSIDAVFHHGDQLLLLVGENVFKYDSKSRQLQLLVSAFDQKVVDMLVCADLLIVLTRKYVKMIEIASASLSKAIAFQGNGLLESNGIIYSYSGDQLLVVENMKSQLLDLHKIVSIPRESLVVRYIGYYNGLYVLTEGNILMLLNSGYKVKMMKQLIVEVDKFVLNDVHIIMNNSEQTFVFLRSNLQLISIIQCQIGSVQQNNAGELILVSPLPFYLTIGDVESNGRATSKLVEITFTSGQNSALMSHYAFDVAESVFSRADKAETQLLGQLHDGDYSYQFLRQRIMDSEQFVILTVLRKVVINVAYLEARYFRHGPPKALFLLNRQYQIAIVVASECLLLISLFDGKVKFQAEFPFRLESIPQFRFDENSFLLSNRGDEIYFQYDLPAVVKGIYDAILKDFNSANSVSCRQECILDASSDSEFY